jgi:hypothetical protein
MFTSVPHNHGAWWVIGFAILAGFIGAVVATANGPDFSGQNRYMLIHMYLLLVLAGAMFFTMVYTCGMWLAGDMRGVLWFRRVGDEDRTLNMYRYTQWLISARQPQLTEHEWKAHIREQEHQQLQFRLRAAFAARSAKVVSGEMTEEEASAVRTFNESSDEESEVEFRPPPMKPPGDITASYYPMKFLIVLAVSAVIVATLIYISFYIYEKFTATLENITAQLPEPPVMSPDEEARVNKDMQDAVIVAFDIVAGADPRLGFLRSFEAQIRKMNVFAMWQTIFVVVNEMKWVVGTAVLAGTTTGICAVVATWIAMLISVPQLQMRMRRGELRKIQAEATVTDADRYVGIHCMHFVLAFESVFWIVFVIFVFLLTPSLVQTVFRALIPTVLASLISSLITLFIEKVIVARVFVRGLSIRWVYSYFTWTMLAIILGLINGVVRTIARWFTAIFSITALFARLDLDLFPESLLFLDSGYSAFYGMLAFDEQYNNPVFLTAAAVFLTELEIMRDIRTGTKTPIAEFGKNRMALPHLRNLVNIRARHISGNPLSLREPLRHAEYPDDIFGIEEEDFVRRRVQQRWRLARVLILNPSLIKRRKHAVQKEWADRRKSLKPEEKRRYTLQRRASELSPVMPFGRGTCPRSESLGSVNGMAVDANSTSSEKSEGEVLSQQPNSDVSARM